MNVDKAKAKVLEGIYVYAEILVKHKGATLERDNLDSLVKAYAVLNNQQDEIDFKKTLKETSNL